MLLGQTIKLTKWLRKISAILFRQECMFNSNLSKLLDEIDRIYASNTSLLKFFNLLFSNKLKSLKVAQLKDETDDDEDYGCDVVW